MKDKSSDALTPMSKGSEFLHSRAEVKDIIIVIVTVIIIALGVLGTGAEVH